MSEREERDRKLERAMSEWALGNAHHPEGWSCNVCHGRGEDAFAQEWHASTCPIGLLCEFWALLRGQQVEQTEPQPANGDGDVPGQARAWLAVCDLLDELEVPRFNEETARQGALRAIRQLHAAARQTPPARQQDEADAADLAWVGAGMDATPLERDEALRALEWLFGEAYGRASLAAQATAIDCRKIIKAALSGRAASEPVRWALRFSDGSLTTNTYGNEEVAKLAARDWTAHGHNAEVVPLGIIGAPGDSEENGNG